jgi:hypothetical protein
MIVSVRVRTLHNTGRGGRGRYSCQFTLMITHRQGHTNHSYTSPSEHPTRTRKQIGEWLTWGRYIHSFGPEVAHLLATPPAIQSMGATFE